MGKAGGKFRLTPPGRLLVLETTGCLLYGTVVRGGLGGAIGHGPVASSRAVDCDQALQEVLEQLRGDGKTSLPKNAILITPAAASDLLELPVDPKNRKAAKNVGEMVRWELEERFLALGDVWTLGALLMGGGDIDAGQRRQVESGAGGSGLAANTAYGELVGRERVSQAMERMEALLGLEGELLTGAVPQPAEEQIERYTWWGAGINEGVCRRWVEACRRRQIHLGWVYPQLGGSLPLIEEPKAAWLLAEIRQEQVALFQYRKGRLEALSLRPSDAGEVDGEALFRAIRAVLHHETKTVYLSGGGEQATGLAEELRRRLQQEVVLLADRFPDAAAACASEIRLSLLGCARHALGHARPATAVRVRAQKPRPPLWKNREIYPWLGIVLVVVGAFAVDTYLRQRAKAMEWELELADIDYKKKLEMKREAQRVADEIKALEDRLAAREKELKEEERLHYILNEVVRYRQDLAPAILEAIGDAINDEVVLDLLEEDSDRRGFYMEGWALHDTKGQIFVNDLGEALSAWKYKIEEVKVDKGAGRYGLDGFRMKVWLRKMVEAQAPGKNQEDAKKAAAAAGKDKGKDKGKEQGRTKKFPPPAKEPAKKK